MQAKLVLALVQVCHQVSEGRTDCVRLHDLPCAADLGALPDPSAAISALTFYSQPRCRLQRAASRYLPCCAFSSAALPPRGSARIRLAALGCSSHSTYASSRATPPPRGSARTRLAALGCSPHPTSSAAPAPKARRCHAPETPNRGIDTRRRSKSSRSRRIFGTVQLKFSLPVF
jgi:hypothetical protein